MKERTLILVIVLAGVLVQDGTTYAQGKDQMHTDSLATKHVEQKSEVYSCPMHPEVASDKPGKCPKCGMTLVLRKEEVDGLGDHQTVENSAAKDKIEQARSLLAGAKKDLAQDGKYNCCIKDPWDRCALDHQSCPCADDVKVGKSVCPDCYAGWQRGDGIVEGVKASSVKGTFHSHSHKR